LSFAGSAIPEQGANRMNTGSSIEVSLSPRKIMEGLHEHCSKTLAASLDPKFDAQNGSGYRLSEDLDHWSSVLDGRRENALYLAASREYVLALLSNCQGQYRNAFKGLRLVLELVLQGTFLSAHLVPLSEWLSNLRDTTWTAIIDRENGALSKTFCRAFFPDLTDQAAQVQTIAATLYRELSETTHGNVPKQIPLPDQLAFHEPTFLLWHRKARSLSYIINFTLTMRYFSELKTDQLNEVRPIIIDELAHLEPVRVLLGGPASNE
jgi:hypothetical protein